MATTVLPFENPPGRFARRVFGYLERSPELRRNADEVRLVCGGIELVVDRIELLRHPAAEEVRVGFHVERPSTAAVVGIDFTFTSELSLPDNFWEFEHYVREHSVAAAHAPEPGGRFGRGDKPNGLRGFTQSTDEKDSERDEEID